MKNTCTQRTPNENVLVELTALLGPQPNYLVVLDRMDFARSASENFAICGVFVLDRMHFSSRKVMCPRARAAVRDLAAESRNFHYAPPLTSRAPVSFDLKTRSLLWELVFSKNRNKLREGVCMTRPNPAFW